MVRLGPTISKQEREGKRWRDKACEGGLSLTLVPYPAQDPGWEELWPWGPQDPAWGEVLTLGQVTAVHIHRHSKQLPGTYCAPGISAPSWSEPSCPHPNELSP